MKNFSANFVLGLSLFFASTSRSEAAPEIIKRNIVHKCRSFIVALKLIPDDKADAALTKQQEALALETEEYLYKKWEPTSYNYASRLKQMEQAGTLYQQIRHEGFSAEIAALATNKSIFEQLIELSVHGLSHEQILTALRENIEIDYFIRLLKQAKFDFENALLFAKFKAENEARRIKIRNTFNSPEFYEEISVSVSLYQNTLAKARELGFTFQTLEPLINEIAKKYQNASLEGYLEFYKAGLEHSESMELSSHYKKLPQIMQFVSLGFSTKQILEIFEIPIKESLALSVYHSALAQGFDPENARQIATDDPLSFAQKTLLNTKPDLESEPLQHTTDDHDD